MCSLCQATFDRFTDLLAHHKNTHNSDLSHPLRCRACGRTQTSEAGLVHHQIYVCKMVERPYTCEVGVAVCRVPCSLRECVVKWALVVSGLCGGWNSLLIVCWALCCCVVQHCGFYPPLGRIFQVEWIFSLELAWVLTPFPQNSFGWEYKPSCSLLTRIPPQGLKRSQHSCSRRVNVGNKNTPSRVPHRLWS